MAEEPMKESGGSGDIVSPEDDAAGPSTDLVLRERHPAVARARRWPDAVVRTRGWLLGLRQHPAAVVSVSAAATVGTALLTTALRRALGDGGALPSAGRTTSVALRGEILHEVHVIHHVVHHVVRPPAP